MNPPDPKVLACALSRALPGTPEVRITGVASLGAQRQTLFLELRPSGADSGVNEPRQAVAQIASQVVAAASVAGEASLLQAARAAGVRVPAVLAVDEDLAALVSERVDGESIPRRILRMTEADPRLGARLTADLGEAFARIHRIPTGDLKGFEDLSSGRAYVEHLEVLVNGLATPHPSFRLGLRWLHRNLGSLCDPSSHGDRSATEGAPDGSGVAPCLVHGDLRLGNFLTNNEGLTAVLDWELAHRGDPMEDLAWICLRTWRFGNDALVVGGFGDLEDLRKAYETAGGTWRKPAFTWWTVARTLWWGIGLARQVEAFLEGGSNSIVLAASGRRVVELEYDLLRLIEA